MLKFKTMKTAFLFLCILFIGFVSCNKENTVNSSLKSTFIDTALANRYYSVDIVPTQFTELYNNWKLVEISGGFSGNGYKANFDNIVFKQNGIYSITNGDTLKEFGKINIVDQSNGLTISLIPDSLSGTVLFDSEKQIDLTHRDTLILNAPCCDRYNYMFIK